ncbi:MAG: CTP synthase [Rhodobacteraceae bacterium]|nr:CTP synthase [Paracoccaceae bacterium]
MTRFVFVTGGVVSSLGKGLTAAALGALLQACGYSVRLRKLDPYLNVDPGTMSPYEHGEVFVTEDGAETDLDIGHYERFTGVSARRNDSTSSGRIYSAVLEKEREGRYLGQTIQVIPHVTNEIKDFLAEADGSADFVLCEIGGTIGDIEGLPFYEAIRQFTLERPQGQCALVHVTLVPYLESCRELKTKPTQHSVKELRSIGLAPDVLVCRSNLELPERERQKIALFCNVHQDSVISAPNLESIYLAPVALHRRGLDRAVLQSFGIDPLPLPELSKWRTVVKRIANPEGRIRVAVVGKYTGLDDAYKSIAEALTHGGLANRVSVEVRWIPAENFESEDPRIHLEGCHAILIPGGFGERGSEGKVRAAEFARTEKVPFFGICLGMQMAVIEAVRNLLGVANAGSEEFIPKGEEHLDQIEPVVFYLEEWIRKGSLEVRCKDGAKGATMRLGAYPATLQEGSKVASIYCCTTISERHRHRYEIDVRYRDRLAQHGVVFSGMSPDDVLPEILEIVDHPWFIGVQFHPELKSRPYDPHPLFADFVRAAINYSRLF